LLSAGALAEFLAACAGQTTTTTGNVKATWTGVVIPENLDPHIGFDTDTLQFTQNVYEGLLEYTPGGLDVRPLLAESFSVAPDGLAYTFKLRQGIVFHDGAKFDSQAVLANFQRLQGINQGPASYLINIAGFDAPLGSSPRSIIADSIITSTQRELMPMMKGMVQVPQKEREHSQWQFGFPVKLAGAPPPQREVLDKKP
jgi:ABC-type transport system substrate-binding protein